jgi:2-keto-4-pentenoate hydratase
MDSVTSISERLLEARARRVQIAPPEVPTEDLAYAVQEAIAAKTGGFVAWKIGAVPPRNTILPAPILAATVERSGITFASGRFFMIGVEAEIAFVLNREFPAARATPPREDEIWSSIGAVHVAMEIVDTRISNWRSAPTWVVLADSLCSGALVVGEELADWRTRGLQAPGLELFVDGVRAAPAGANVVDDPFSLIGQLLGHCARRGIDLPSGAVVTTGSSTGMHFVQPGGIAELRLGDRVMVQARFEA